MGHSADMPDLQKNRSAAQVDSVGNQAPTLGLLRCINARSASIALAKRRDIGSFRNDQASARSLRIIVRHQRIGDVSAGGARSGHRGHDDAVFQFAGT
ncbi:hypothetical protein D3C76_742270 [compost metagenome]